jgi:peptidyl-prolyl cis-trans isomerase B (cyclophilin B)
MNLESKNPSGSIFHRHAAEAFIFLLLLVLPVISCRERSRLRPAELRQTQLFAEILRRTDTRSLGKDPFLKNNMLFNSDPRVRRWCAIALARIADPSGLPWLYEALHKEDAALRAAAAFAIGSIQDRTLLQERSIPPDPRALDELMRLLDDSSVSVQMRAIEALGRAGSGREAAAIIRKIENFHHQTQPVAQAFLELSAAALVRLNAADRNSIPAIAQRLPGWKKNLAQVGINSEAPKIELTEAGEKTVSVQDSNWSGEAITEATCYALASDKRNTTIAIVETDKGVIEIELFREDAPVTTAHFINLAHHGVYNGLKFEAANPSRIQVQTPKMDAGPGRMVGREINMRPFEKGSFGMALAKGSGAKQLFITLKPQPLLDGMDTCFGHVIGGLPVAEKLAPGDGIKRVRIKEQRSFFRPIQ